MIGEKIKAYRLSVGMNQADFANKIGIRQGHLSEIERGTKNAGGKVLKSLFRLFPELSGDIFEKETPVKRPDSGHLTGGREEMTIEEVRERYEEKTKYFMPAIGPQMTPYPISEGEMLIIDPEADPKENDLVLESSPEGPAIKIWRPGTTPLGVVVLATKNRETIRKTAGRISQTK